MLVNLILTRRFGSPRSSWVPPIDSFKHVAELSGRDGDRAIRWRGPDEAPPLQPFGIKRHAEAVMPEDLQKIAAFAAKDIKIAGMWIAPQRLLNLYRETIHAATHIGHTGRQPDMNPGRRRYHPRSAAITRRNVARLTSCPARTIVPSTSVISICPSVDAEVVDEADGVDRSTGP
jgi:hypothetical protein